MKYLFLFTVILSSTALADDWPQWRGPQRDGVWREDGIVKQLPEGQIPITWSRPIAGGYCGPTVANGRVYVMDRALNPDRERVWCFDAKDGKVNWKHAYDCGYASVKYPAGPRASVTIQDAHAWAIGSRGHIHCYEAETGTVVWQRDLETELEIDMPIWGIAGSPLIVDEQVILQVSGQGACVVGLDKMTGKERWRALDDPASYSAPTLIEQAGRKLVVVLTGARAVALDPVDGSVAWEHPFPYTPNRWVIAISTPVRHEDRMIFTSADMGMLVLRLHSDKPAIEKLWWRKDQDDAGLNLLMCTPYTDGKAIYGANSTGVFRAVDYGTGDRLWKDVTATEQIRFSNMHIVKHRDHEWIFNNQGELIICDLKPDGYHELSRARLIKPTKRQQRKGNGVTWSHPAFAYRHVFARSDEEIVCASLAADKP